MALIEFEDIVFRPVGGVTGRKLDMACDDDLVALSIPGMLFLQPHRDREAAVVGLAHREGSATETDVAPADAPCFAIQRPEHVARSWGVGLGSGRLAEHLEDVPE